MEVMMMEIRIARMAITTRSSIRVKPLPAEGVCDIESVSVFP
jgi:hypothetical protein